MQFEKVLMTLDNWLKENNKQLFYKNEYDLLYSMCVTSQKELNDGLCEVILDYIIPVLTLPNNICVQNKLVSLEN